MLIGGAGGVGAYASGGVAQGGARTLLLEHEAGAVGAAELEACPATAASVRRAGGRLARASGGVAEGGARAGVELDEPSLIRAALLERRALAAARAERTA